MPCLYAFLIAAIIFYLYPVVGISVVAFVVALIAYFAFFVYREFGRKERELKKQGFHIEYISSGILREGLDRIAIVYHETNGKIWFYGIHAGSQLNVTIPAGDEWVAKVPWWAEKRRELIVKRIQKAMPKLVIV